MLAPDRLTLPYGPDVAAATAHLYPLVSRSVEPAEWELYAPYVARILELKRERNAVILAHQEIAKPFALAAGEFIEQDGEIAKDDITIGFGLNGCQKNIGHC